MNDVLKSLTITDRNGGKIDGVRYDASESLDKRLADFPFAWGAVLAGRVSRSNEGRGARNQAGAGEAGSGTIAGARVVARDDKDQPVQHEERDPAHGRGRNAHHRPGRRDFRQADRSQAAERCSRTI